MFVAHHFDPHSTTNHPTSPSSDPLPCSLSPTGSALDGLGFAHPSLSRQLAWPNRFHLRCGLGVSHSVAPDHASRHRPYSVLLVLSRFNNAGLSPALISAPWRAGTGVLARQIAPVKTPLFDPSLCMVSLIEKNEPMKIAVMGSGGVGGYFGARLAQGGCDVGFIARGAHLAALRGKWLVVESNLGNISLPKVR